MSNGKTILKMFKEYEEKKFKDAESKNRLESLMYAIPEITEDTDLMNFGTPVEMEKLRQDAKDLDDWFFEDEAFHADYKVFDAKHDGLRKQINRLQFRKNESEGREGLVQVLDARILQSSNNIGEMTTTRPWIPTEKIDSAQARVGEVKTWLDAKVAEQAPMSTTEDPVLLSSVLNEKMKVVKMEYETLRLIKKPVEKKKEEPKKADEPKKAQPGDGPKIDPEMFKNFGGDGSMDGANIEKMFENMREKQGLSKEQWDAQFADMANNFDAKDAKKFDKVETMDMPEAEDSSVTEDSASTDSGSADTGSNTTDM